MIYVGLQFDGNDEFVAIDTFVNPAEGRRWVWGPGRKRDHSRSLYEVPGRANARPFLLALRTLQRGVLLEDRDPRNPARVADLLIKSATRALRRAA